MKNLIKVLMFPLLFISISFEYPGSIFYKSSSSFTQDYTRYLAWQLGSKVSLAAIGYQSGISRSAALSIIEKVQPAAEYFKVKIPTLPYYSGTKVEFAAVILNYLLNDFGDSIGRALADNYPTDHQYLFEVAIKSNLLLMLYMPGDDLSKTISSVIRDRAPRAGIAYSDYFPVVNRVESGASYTEVKEAINKMHVSVADHLFHQNLYK